MRRRGLNWGRTWCSSIGRIPDVTGAASQFLSYNVVAPSPTGGLRVVRNFDVTVGNCALHYPIPAGVTDETAVLWYVIVVPEGVGAAYLAPDFCVVPVGNDDGHRSFVSNQDHLILVGWAVQGTVSHRICTREVELNSGDHIMIVLMMRGGGGQFPGHSVGWTFSAEVAYA